MNTNTPFSGSYRPGDVSFLLKRIDLVPMEDVDEKERLIQSGKRHYSEMLSIERQPSPDYLRLFHEAAQINAPTMARDLIRVARVIEERRPNGIVLVSLARAGTPVGVALKRLYAEMSGRDVPHYSISIIRDRGIDAAALDYICALHDPRSIVFVDGWTGKGAITTELHSSVPAYNAARGTHISADLFVLADLAGTSGGCGSIDDYLIPSSVLNATISGLVSRSVLNEQIGPGDFHGCLFYRHLADQDLSLWFIDYLMNAVRMQLIGDRWLPVSAPDRAEAARRSEQLVNDLMHRFSIDDRNYVKPGIGESTRSLLRRSPRVLCLNAPDAPDTKHLRLLARERGVPVQIIPTLRLKAAAIIKDLAHA